LPLAPVATAYVYAAFLLPQPNVGIVLRTLPVVPFAIWVTFYDRNPPWQKAPKVLQLAGRLVLLIGTVAFAALVLGFGLNWVFDANRVG
jgi:hypothetical protein